MGGAYERFRVINGTYLFKDQNSWENGLFICPHIKTFMCTYIYINIKLKYI